MASASHPPSESRRIWVAVHRWAGLYMAFFLVVAGLTGSVLAFHGELNAWLNPQSLTVQGSGPVLDPVTLLRKAREQAPPTVRLGDSIPLTILPDTPVSFIVDAAIDPKTGEPFRNVPRELYFDPHTGRLVHTRIGEPEIWPITRANVLGLVLRLHYSLALPGSIGTWLFGIAAAVWTIDCLVGVYLTFPMSARRRKRDTPLGRRASSWWSRWKPAWLVRWCSGGFKVNFDLHRAIGLWVWALLFVFAWSSVKLNLAQQVYDPVMAVLFDMRPVSTGAARPVTTKGGPSIGWQEAVQRARRLAADEGRTKGFKVVGESELFFDSERRLYTYAFSSDQDISGGASLVFDAGTGALLSLTLPARQRFGPWATEWMVAIHTAQVGGLPMKLVVGATGLLVVVLSVTGVIVWWRKRKGRAARQTRPQPTSGERPGTGLRARRL